MNALFYLLKSGCQWRMLPNDFAPWKTVYDHFQKWIRSGRIERLCTRLRRAVRLMAGRHLSPSVAVTRGAQSVPTARQGGSRSRMLLRTRTPVSGLFWERMTTSVIGSLFSGACSLSWSRAFTRGSPVPGSSGSSSRFCYVVPVSLDGLVGVFLAELPKHSVHLLQVEERGGRDADDECAGEVEGHDNRFQKERRCARSAPVIPALRLLPPVYAGRAGRQSKTRLLEAHRVRDGPPR